MQREQSEINKVAWNHRAYEFWLRRNGTTQEFAAKICTNPRQYLRRHLSYLGDVNGNLNILGSNGRKAVPLAVLGADVTVIDISQENARYARELAEAAGVDLESITADFIETDTERFSSDSNNY